MAQRLGRRVRRGRRREAAVVEGVADSHVLVNIVDNDYVNGDIFAPFSSLFYLP